MHLKEIILNTVKDFSPIHPQQLFRQIKERAPGTKDYEIAPLLGELVFEREVRQALTGEVFVGEKVDVS